MRRHARGRDDTEQKERKKRKTHTEEKKRRGTKRGQTNNAKEADQPQRKGNLKRDPSSKIEEKKTKKNRETESKGQQRREQQGSKQQKKRMPSSYLINAGRKKVPPHNGEEDFAFKRKYPLDARRRECESILSRHQGRIAVIVEPHEGSPPIDKTKYLIPIDLTCGQFLYILRRRIRLGKEQALFLHARNSLLVGTDLVSKVSADEDGFIYVKYAIENAFGFHVEKTIAKK